MPDTNETLTTTKEHTGLRYQKKEGLSGPLSKSQTALCALKNSIATQLYVQDMTVTEVIGYIQGNQDDNNHLLEGLMIRAAILDYKDQHFAALTEIAHKFIDHIKLLNTGMAVPSEWVQNGSRLITQAQNLLGDPITPNELS